MLQISTNTTKKLKCFKNYTFQRLFNKSFPKTNLDLINYGIELNIYYILYLFFTWKRKIIYRFERDSFTTFCLFFSIC